MKDGQIWEFLTTQQSDTDTVVVSVTIVYIVTAVTNSTDDNEQPDAPVTLKKRMSIDKIMTTDWQRDDSDSKFHMSENDRSGIRAAYN